MKSPMRLPGHAFCLILFLFSPLLPAYNGGSTPGQMPDPTPGQIGFASGNIQVSENIGEITLAVNRTAGSSGAVAADYNTLDVSAQAGEAYTSTQGTLSWADTESGIKFITVPIIDNSTVETQERSFQVLLSNLTGGASGGQNSVTVTITNDDMRNPDDLLKAARNPTQVAIAENILDVVSNGDASPELLNTFYDLMDNVHDHTDQVSNALQNIAPEEYLAQGQLAIDGLSVQQRNVASRLTALRRGVSCVDISGLRVKQNNEILLANELFSPKKYCNDSTVDNKRWSIYATGDVVAGDSDTSERETGFKFDTTGLTLGGDYRLSDYAVVGAALGYQHIKTDFHEQAGRFSTDGYSLSIYGSLYETNKFFMDAIAGFGRNSFDNERYIRYQLDGSNTLVNQIASSSNDSNQYWASIGVGGHIPLAKNFLLTPSMYLDYLKTSIKDISESLSGSEDGAALGMNIDGYDVESTRMRLGWRLSYLTQIGQTSFVPFFGIQGVYDLKGDRSVLQGYFQQDAAQKRFSITGDKRDVMYGIINFGFSGEYKRMTVFASYEKLFEKTGLEYDAMSIGLRSEF
ncbi:autotransporter family protein [Candidatus Venteria ishoeyi]|uniref:Outer membrane protein B n=1 Tax=Candidatus Venteria ishoeyi TaxID=1899563 RepID=A0A1H6FB89_9GAMM|nr:autotransporter domain-containing protein [Candidatus Venteria ishoeyi]MDM8546372.1 autotransporter domain-containing protein [Candidatus Venteria ishoeyi]SEH06903.1 Outer membrane protein B precursor [Candidatus Venteria ishoeyi]